jgi:hypothetical protein
MGLAAFARRCVLVAASLASLVVRDQWGLWVLQGLRVKTVRKVRPVPMVWMASMACRA